MPPTTPTTPTTRQRKGKVRLQDIADRSDMSVATVSMALADHPHVSDQTKRLVRRISREMGYKGAASSVRRKAASPCRVGMMSIGNDLTDATYATILQHVQEHAQQADMRLELSGTSSKFPEDTLDHIMQFARGLNGLILIGYVTQSMLRALSNADRPCVLLGQMFEQQHTADFSGVYTVEPDIVQMARLAVHRMFEKGHRRVAYLCEQTPTGLADAQLLTGYRIAHMEAGIAIDEALVHVSGEMRSGAGPAAEAFAKLAEPPSAYLLPTPSFASSLAQWMASNGKTLNRQTCYVIGQPSTARTFGVEDMNLIHFDADAMGSLTIDLLGRLISGATEASHRILLPMQTDWVDG